MSDLSMASTADPFMLTLIKGDSVVDSILNMANKIKINSASISGIGALENPILGCYDPKTKQYRYKNFSGFYELVALHGNITQYEDGYIAHIHVALGDDSYKVIAGHLKNAIVGVTAEITVIPFKNQIVRRFNPDFNACLINV